MGKMIITLSPDLTEEQTERTMVEIRTELEGLNNPEVNRTGNVITIETISEDQAAKLKSKTIRFSMLPRVRNAVFEE